MRLLNPDSLVVNLQELGIEPELQEMFNLQLNRPDGLILNTGPTGSGKTTTLYAFLKQTLTPGIKIITIEDPIEYHLSGIVQTQVESRKRSTILQTDFEQCTSTRSLTLLWWEKFEILKLLKQRFMHHLQVTLYSLPFTQTQQLVHLLDSLTLGVNPKVLTSAIRIAIAQRLVRKLCPDCKKITPT
jgi:type II secretory ATPase GspE/PulE/Tfp pilus assembly ATPase PilB-like protein